MDEGPHHLLVHAITAAEFVRKIQLLFHNDGFLHLNREQVFFDVSIKNIIEDKIVFEAANLARVENGMYHAHFQSENMHLFFEAEVTHNTLVCKSTVVKYDLRKNNRISTYPHHNVYFYVNESSLEDVVQNVIPFKRVNSIDENKIELEKFKTLNSQLNPVKNSRLKFRVNDISSTGINILCSMEEMIELKKNKSFDNSILEFNGVLIDIQKSEFRYQIESIDQKYRGIRMQKVGIEFINPSESYANFLRPYLQNHLEVARELSTKYNGLVKRFL